MVEVVDFKIEMMLDRDRMVDQEAGEAVRTILVHQVAPALPVKETMEAPEVSVRSEDVRVAGAVLVSRVKMEMRPQKEEMVVMESYQR